MRQAFKLALSLVLFYWFALVMNWDVANYGSLAIVLVSLGTRGATLEKGIARVIGTTFGVVIGFLLLAILNHDRWMMMLAFACYLAVVGFFMQGSRNGYAWFVTAFVPLVIWGDNYPNFEKAFYFGTFRWLETTVGIGIYTLVDLLLWPRLAGTQFEEHGKTLCSKLQAHLASSVAKLADSRPSPASPAVNNELAESLTAATTSLQQALLDTPAIRSKRRAWQTWQRNTTELCRTLDLWNQSVDECRQFDIDQSVSGTAHALSVLEKRLARISDHWNQISTAPTNVNSSDADLLEPFDLRIDQQASQKLPAVQRASMSRFINQLETMDRSSRAALSSLRIVVGLDAEQSHEDLKADRNMEHSILERRHRLLGSLFPVFAFVGAFLFWVFVNPPTGPKVPMFAGIISLVILRTPINPVPLVGVLILSIFFAVAPIYWLVMPAIETGEGLLCLIFAYALFFGYLGGSRPVLKAGPMVMFVNMAGISNQQTYSFQGPVDGAIMVLLGVGFVALVYLVVTPLRPEPVPAY